MRLLCKRPVKADTAIKPARVTRAAETTDARMLRVMMAAAAYHARKVARTMRLSDVDREDVEQDILLVLLERRRFNAPPFPSSV